MLTNTIVSHYFFWSEAPLCTCLSFTHSLSHSPTHSVRQSLRSVTVFAQIQPYRFAPKIYDLNICPSYWHIFYFYTFYLQSHFPKSNFQVQYFIFSSVHLSLLWAVILVNPQIYWMFKRKPDPESILWEKAGSTTPGISCKESSYSQYAANREIKKKRITKNTFQCIQCIYNIIFICDSYVWCEMSHKISQIHQIYTI